jgi:endonuclease III
VSRQSGKAGPKSGRTGSNSGRTGSNSGEGPRGTGRIPRESKKARRERAARIYGALKREYPQARTALEHANPFELAVATILSAQCTDARVNMVTPALFQRFPDAAALAGAPTDELEAIIHSTGFFRSKARSLVGMARAVMAEYGGELPGSLAELTKLPGIGRKTANVILGNAFGVDEGVVVDTHVKRLSGRLGFSKEVTPEKIELDLMEVFPRERWTPLSHLLIFHGRQVCVARKPRCRECVVASLCPSATL